MALFASKWNDRSDDDWVRGRGTKHLPHTLEVSRAHAGDRRNNGIVVYGRDLPLGRIVQRAAYRGGVKAVMRVATVKSNGGGAAGGRSSPGGEYSLER